METFEEIYKKYSINNRLIDMNRTLLSPVYFIQEIIESHKKDYLQGFEEELYKQVNNLSKERALHIVSTYILGIQIYNRSELLKQIIDNEIKKFRDKTFEFFWFLIAIYHDLGYEYEINNTPSESETLGSFLKSEGYNRLNNSAGVPQIYEKNYRLYFKYRIKRHGRYDHGICAAHILYNDLRQIRKERHWNKRLDSIYNYAAWVILAHNIWYVKDSSSYDAKVYEKFKLNDLILKEEDIDNGTYPIELSKYPLLFLLCLVDSIEPLKKIKKVPKLSQIECEIKDNEIVIQSNLTCGCHDAIINQAKDLNNWLTKTGVDGNQVTIHLIHK
jgi:hypothetical protein